MAVDRGELRYKILVEDQFTKPIRAFRTELLKAKDTLDFVKTSAVDFRNVTREIGQATTQVRRFTTASSSSASQQAKDQKEAEKAQREHLRALNARTQAEIKQGREIARLRAQAERDQRAHLKTLQATQKAQQQVAVATKNSASQFNALNAAFAKTDRGGNRLLFTFRRLFGALAAFTVARQAIAGFAGLVSGAVTFNRVIEESRLGIAGLFTALGDIRDEAGNLTTGPDAFAIALGVADEQLDELRADALKTTATFEQLVDTFQVALGPGLAAGLSVDEIRKVSVLVSQAASALRISQDQLSEEIRALLTGAGTQRTSRIFTALGFSGPEIKAARDAGVLFEVLERRLRAFGKAAEAAQNTFTGLSQRLTEAVSLVSGRAGLGFFVELKDVLKELGDLFVTVERDAEGVIQKIIPRPEAVQTLAILFSGLQDAVATIRAGVRALSLTEVQNAIALIAAAFRGIAQVVSGFIQGLVTGLSDLAVIGRNLFASFDSPALREAVKLATRLGVLLAAAGAAAGLLSGAFRLAIAPMILLVNLAGKLLTVVQVASIIIGKIPGKLFTWVGILGVIFAAFGKIFESILGIELSIGDVAKIIALSFETAFGEIVRFGEIVFKEFANVLVGIFTDPLGTIAGLFSDLFSGVLKVASGLTAVLGISEDFRANIEKAVATFETLSQKTKPKPIFDTAKDSAALNQFVADSQKKFDALAADIAKRSANKKFNLKVGVDTAGTEDTLTSLLRSVNEEITGLLGGDIVDEKAILDKLTKVTDEIQKRLGQVQAKEQEAQLTAFDKLIRGMISKNEDFLNVLRNSVTGFADFASSAIVDAFDPTKDVDLRERFARFLQDIAKQILQTIITLLIATAIAKRFGVPLPSDNQAVPDIPGLAEGGEVPGGNYNIPRPASVPSSDTTPAWLTPGEFVQTVDAVRRYGLDVMEAIRTGAIDPLSLRSLAGLDAQRTIKRTVRRSGGLAFADGGLVPSANVQATQQTLAAKDTDQKPTIALIAGNEQALDRLLAGGKGAMLDFMKANASTIDGILARNRT
jgi:hypothetical protein